MIDIIVNPHSCSGKGMKIWNRIEKIFKQSGMQYQVHFTEYKGHATDIAADLTKIKDHDHSEKTIVVLGGDGSLNEVINGIAFECRVALGYIPTGSGNDFARSLMSSEKGKKSPKQMAESILYPKKYEWLDYGVILAEGKQVTNRRFAVSSGIGMDAAVCYDLLDSKIKSSFNKYGLKKLSYLMVGVKQLIKMAPIDGILQIDGGRKMPLKQMCFVSFHIHPYEGGGFKFAPKADYSDGLLDVCVMSERGRLKMVPVLLHAIWGRHPHRKGVKIFQCREAHLELGEPRKVHADGEAFGIQSNITVRCIGKQIRLIR